MQRRSFFLLLGQGRCHRLPRRVCRLRGCHILTQSFRRQFQCDPHWFLVSGAPARLFLACPAAASCPAATGCPGRLLFCFGATCTRTAASGGFAVSTSLARRWVFRAARQGKPGAGQQTRETKASQDPLELLCVHHSPPFQLLVRSCFSSQDRKNVPKHTDYLQPYVTIAHLWGKVNGVLTVFIRMKHCILLMVHHMG